MSRVRLDGPAPALPLRLADQHRARPVGDAVELVREGDEPPLPLARLATRAGFEVIATAPGRVTAVRARALPDTVGPGMRVLLVGLNPSLHAADAGYGFAGPSNRFWPAALAAGLVSTAHDSRAALVDDRVGMTDLVKRPSPSARELTAGEYRDGLAELAELCAWLRPPLVCFVGLSGYRAARDRRAVAGAQEAEVGGSAVYVMPNPSGLNAHTSHDDLVGHFRAVLELATGRQVSKPTGQLTPVPPMPQ